MIIFLKNKHTLHIDEFKFKCSIGKSGLSKKKIDSVSGIIGADILKKSKAILDYKSNKLYLKL